MYVLHVINVLGCKAAREAFYVVQGMPNVFKEEVRGIFAHFGGNL
jgi:uncharacterized protein YbaR (Trm112 family)